MPSHVYEIVYEQLSEYMHTQLHAHVVSVSTHAVTCTHTVVLVEMPFLFAYCLLAPYFQLTNFTLSFLCYLSSSATYI